MKAVDNSKSEYKISNASDIFTIKSADVSSGAEYLDIYDDSFCANAGDDGYFVIADRNSKGSYLCRFKDRSDYEKTYRQSLMPIFGIKTSKKTVLAIVCGDEAQFNIVFGVKDGKYYIHPRFDFSDGAPYEDIKIRFITLDPSCGYVDMAKEYRKYQLERGACVPIKERMKTNGALSYSASAPMIRIRLGWKPAPPDILEQTRENEPDMHVACTFEDVKKLIDAFKAHGVKKLEICLVGWNKSGHDGRYPEIFPVEEKFGGKEKLEELIKYANDAGYRIVCHTNSNDCYSISEDFADDITIKTKDGKDEVNDTPWSGGRMYHLCPIKALEFAKRDLPKVRALGFCGIHYVDVMTINILRWCHDKNHPATPKKTLECYKEIMKMCHELFGGFSSEGGFDFASEYLDYALYVTFDPLFDENEIDEQIPFWEIVYHGIILSNPSTFTTNFPIKGDKNRLKLYEYGGRPTFFVYANFRRNNDNWLGNQDFACHTDEEREFCADMIGKAYREFEKSAYLQTEFIENYEMISDNVFKTEYSDKTQVICDYNNMTVEIKK